MDTVSKKHFSFLQPSIDLLSLPQHYSVELIPSGCCGMAGSFGYEKEHYSLSMAIGELVLLPRRKKMLIRKPCWQQPVPVAGTRSKMEPDG